MPLSISIGRTDTTAAVKDKFAITAICRSCHSDNVELYAGVFRTCGEVAGVLNLQCKDCNHIVEVEEG